MRLLQRMVAGGAVLALALVGASCGDDTASPPENTGTSTTATSPTTAPSSTQPASTTGAPTTTAPTSTTTAPTTTPPTTTTTTVAPTTAPAETVDVRLYFLRGERLVIAHRSVPGPAVLRGAIEALLAGPTADEMAAGMTTAIPDGTEVHGVDLDQAADGGLATIDLGTAFDSGGGTLSMTARLVQLVFTATQFDNVDAVTLWIDGSPVEALGGEGLIIDEPQTRAMMPRELTGAVLIDAPQPGATVSSPIRVTGEADVYEAQFPIEIWRDGEQIGGLVPVTGGAWGDWGDFDVTIPLDAPAGPIEIVAYDEGGCGDGPECPDPIRTVVEVDLT